MVRPFTFTRKSNATVRDAADINELQSAIETIDAGGTNVGAALTVSDEGVALATAATGIDFVGSGVAVSGVGATKTVLIPGSGSVSLPWLNVKTDFGAVGNGTTDDTSAIQAAINAAHSATYESLVVIPPGNYKITSTLTFYAGTKVQGIGSGNTHIGLPKLIWAGSANVDVFLCSDTGSMVNTHHTWFKGITITATMSGATLSGNRFRHGISWGLNNRGDQGTLIEAVSVQGGSGWAFHFPSGGINVVVRNVRCDYMLGGLLFFWTQRSTGNDSFELVDFTVDNVLSTDLVGTAVAGAAISLDMTSVNGEVWARIAHGKIEVNAGINPSLGGMLSLTCNPNVGNLLMHHVHLDEVWFAHSSSFNSETDISVTPATSAVEIMAHMVKVRNIVGIPNYANSVVGTSGYRSFWICGKGIDVATAPGASDQAMEFAGLVNFMSRGVYRFGKEAGLTTKVNPSSGLTAGTTVNAGDRFETISGSTVTEYYCNLAGTTGTLSGITGSGASGQTTLTVNSTAGLAEGMYISIVGANTGVEIVRMFGTTIILASNLSGTVSGAAVSYRTPTFLTRSAVWS